MGKTPPNASAGPPEGGFAVLVPELGVTDIAASLRFWCGLLGFQIAYNRPESRFAYLNRGEIQVMLCQLNGSWETAALHHPFGRGLNLQMRVDSIAPILAVLEAAGWPLLEPPAESWYRVGAGETGQREFLVQDPDGYLLRFAESLGSR